MSSSSVVSSKDQIVIPAKLRRKYRLEEGVTVLFREEQGRLVLEPGNFAALFALGGTLSEFSLEEALAAEREAERQREDE